MSHNYKIHDQDDLHYHYLYSSARSEAGMPGMLKLEKICGEVIVDHSGNLEHIG